MPSLLPLTNGAELLLADEAQTFADAVVKVLTDREYADQLGQRAAAVVRENHSWRPVTEDFVSICMQANQPRIAYESVDSVVHG